MQPATKPQLVDVLPKYGGLGRRVMTVCGSQVLEILSYQHVKQDLLKILQKIYNRNQDQSQRQSYQRYHKEVAIVWRLRARARVLHIHAEERCREAQR